MLADGILPVANCSTGSRPNRLPRTSRAGEGTFKRCGRSLEGHPYAAAGTALRAVSASARQLSAYLQRLADTTGGTLRDGSPLHARVWHGLRPGAVTAALAAGADNGYRGEEHLRLLACGLPTRSQAAVLPDLVVHGAGARLVSRLRADALSTPGLATTAAAAGAALRKLTGDVRARRIGTAAPPELRRLLADAAARAPHENPPFATRFASGTHVFAAFHPAAPGIPLAVLEAARLTGLQTSAACVLAPPRDPSGKVVVFYSVVAAHPGLAGLGIPAKLVRDTARMESAAGARRTVTLSPIPGFREWMRRAAPMLDAELAGGEGRKELQKMLRRYLVEEKRRGGAVRDPVANFHPGNGARVEAILLDADTGARRMEESYGAMVVSEYCDGEVESNSREYAENGTISCSC